MIYFTYHMVLVDDIITKQSSTTRRLQHGLAYDKVKWFFLQQTPRMKGFSPLWCSSIDKIVKEESVGIKINDDIEHFFQTMKGLTQGDHLSQILFNLVADMLAILIERAKENGDFKGVIPHLVDGGLSILFVEHDLEQAKNLKLVLSTFEQLSGLKINFQKSELYCYGQAKKFVDEYANLFGCKNGNTLFKYLGIPMHHRKLTNKDWLGIEEKFQKKLSSWKGNLLSVGAD